MTTTEINRQFHEALGKCWHDCYMKSECPFNLDYCNDQRLVIEAMRERPDFTLFMAKLMYGFEQACVEGTDWTGDIELDLIMDKTGKLVLLAIEWLREVEHD